MRTLLKHERRPATDQHLIPLINIVFLMLIFFLVAGRIAATDSAMFSAPQSSQDRRLDDSGITILLAADHSVWINEQALDGSLQAFLQQHAVDHETKVVLKVDAALKAPVLDPVLLALQSLGVQKLKLVTIAGAS